jgi:hypothetical protein
VHLFTLLSWNLVARSVSVAKLLFHHLSWRDDALIVNLPKHMGDEEGANAMERHVFANPLRPEICPILALAIVVFGSSGIFGERFVAGDEAEEMKDDNVLPPAGGFLVRQSLFGGSKAEAAFSAWLRRMVIEEERFTVQELGAIPEDIGTHSFRKGCATYLASFPGGPSAIAIYLRAGWSLGQIPTRYVHAGEGADQFVGRLATGLDMTSTDFAVLPAHFDNTFALSEQQWKTIVPGYGKFLCTNRCMCIYYARYVFV